MTVQRHESTFLSLARLGKTIINSTSKVKTHGRVSHVFQTDRVRAHGLHLVDRRVALAVPARSPARASSSKINCTQVVARVSAMLQLKPQNVLRGQLTCVYAHGELLSTVLQRLHLPQLLRPRQARLHQLPRPPAALPTTAARWCFSCGVLGTLCICAAHCGPEGRATRRSD